MATWSRKFWKPVYPKKGEPIETLAGARAFIFALPAGLANRNEWQHAIAKLLAAAEGNGSTHTARDALVNALFLNMMLDLDHE